MKKRHTQELSPQEAADKIGVSSRTILNFINQKRFDAIKVGKEWFIDEASFISFCKRYGYEFENNEKDIDTMKAHETVAKSIQINEVNLHEKNIEYKSDINDKFFESNLTTKEIKTSLNSSKGIGTLRSYQILLAGLKKNESAMDAFRNQSHQSRRCMDGIFKALEELGAGYYSFGTEDKTRHYRRARSHLGSSLAIKLSMNNLPEVSIEFFELIESRVIPSITALLRKIETNKQRN